MFPLSFLLAVLILMVNFPLDVFAKVRCTLHKPQTVREVLHKWSHLGMEGLWESPGRGAKPKWKESDIEFLKECLKNEPRTYNSPGGGDKEV